MAKTQATRPKSSLPLFAGSVPLVVVPRESDLRFCAEQRENYLRRLRDSDNRLVTFAVRDLGLVIVARRYWARRCGGCGSMLTEQDWRGHRCTTGGNP